MTSKLSSRPSFVMSCPRSMRSADARARIDRRIRQRANRRRVVALTAVVVRRGLGGRRTWSAGHRADQGDDPARRRSGATCRCWRPREAPWWIGLFVSDRYDLTIEAGDQQRYTLTVQTVGPNLPDPVSELGPGEIGRSVGGEDAIVDVYGPSPTNAGSPHTPRWPLSRSLLDDQGRMSLGRPVAPR